MGVCDSDIEEAAITSGILYLSLAVLCPVVAFGLVWWRRDKYPISPAPRNWTLYVVALALGPLLEASEMTHPFLLVVLGESSVRPAHICAARFYLTTVGGVGALLSLALSFVQVLARYECASLRCALVFVEEASCDADAVAAASAALGRRLRWVRPWTRNRDVFHAW